MFAPSLRISTTVLLLAGMLAAVPGQGQEPPPPPPVAGPTAPPPAAPAEGAPASPDQPSPAEQVADEGRAAYRDGRFADAFKLFEKAFGLEAKPAYLYNMARAKEKIADYKAAVTLLQKYLDLHRQQNQGADPANAVDVQHLIRDLTQRAFEALPTVTIQSTPPGAQVLVDGATLGTTPLQTHMEPGRYKVTLRLPEHVDQVADLAVPISGQVSLVLALKSKLKRAALSFWANVRGARIVVDGKVVAVTPFSGRIDVEPGRHQISLQREGYRSVEQEVEVPEDKELHSRFVLQPLSSPATFRSYLGWPLVIGGLAGLAGGGVASYFADQEYTGTPRFDQLEGLQNAGYAGGGTVTGVGLALIVWDAVREGIPEEDLVQGPAKDAGGELRPLGPKGGQP